MRYQPQTKEARIDKAIQARLGRCLRTTYSAVISDPVPLEQIDLVLALRRAERERHREQSEAG